MMILEDHLLSIFEQLPLLSKSWFGGKYPNIAYEMIVLI